jgi:hypothetical protein
MHSCRTCVAGTANLASRPETVISASRRHLTNWAKLFDGATGHTDFGPEPRHTRAAQCNSAADRRSFCPMFSHVVRRGDSRPGLQDPRRPVDHRSVRTKMLAWGLVPGAHRLRGAGQRINACPPLVSVAAFALSYAQRSLSTPARPLHRWVRVVDRCTHNGPRHQPTDRRVDVADAA